MIYDRSGWKDHVLSFLRGAKLIVYTTLIAYQGHAAALLEIEYFIINGFLT